MDTASREENGEQDECCPHKKCELFRLLVEGQTDTASREENGE